jgi:uncharacterized protein (TIGR00369 family)
MSTENPGAPDGAASYQQVFSDGVPHQKELGLKVVSIVRGFAVMRLDWQECLVGNPETGVLHGGAITTLLDACCGMAVASKLTDPQPFATLDLRIDYVRPATPRLPVVAEAECFKITHNVAFFRAFAHHGDKADPIASAAGTFMLATKGQARAAQALAFADTEETSKKEPS